MEKMKLAILGAGKIAATMASTVREMEEVELYAVAARKLEKAQEFADTYGARKAFGGYEEMLKDEDIDLVYVATPHSHHFEHAKLCIQYGKPVLCEKAFTRTAKEAEELLAFAKERGVFITEAMWVRYMPMTRTLLEILNSGRIGAVTALTANLGYSLMDVERMVRPELAGGALLDLGVYTLNFATTVFGDDIKTFSSAMVPHDTGVDKQEFIDLTYADGKVAGLFNTMQNTTDRKGYIYGTKGYMVVDNVNNYEAFHIYNEQYELVETIERPKQISGYEYEVLACKRALEEGKLECEEMPHAHTMRIMKLMDRIRESWQ
ncbi:MAG: Gfo/Idh/MocA family oxidoreductase [Candidatus Choladocola sp.]|nr:Gfo/Idh/MocA family oxidoreductase [Candidatus Choladocola sp.]